MSVEPPSNWEAVTVTFPSASRSTVISFPTITGAVVSTTWTIASSVSVFPDSSVTVSVTVLSPIFSQVNTVSGIDRVISEQASEEFLLISAAVKV